MAFLSTNVGSMRSSFRIRRIRPLPQLDPGPRWLVEHTICDRRLYCMYPIISPPEALLSFVQMGWLEDNRKFSTTRSMME